MPGSLPKQQSDTARRISSTTPARCFDLEVEILRMNDTSQRLTKTDQEPAEAALQAEGTDLMARLLKALKAYRLYQPGHRTLLGFIEDFHDHLQESLSHHGNLTLRVSQDQITWEGLAVYRNPAKEESLSFRLFIQGVRELSFQPGIPVSEVNELLEVLHRAFDTKTSVEDLLSLLWEKDLSYVDFIVLDDFFEEGEQAEFDEFTQQSERNDASASPMRETMGPLLDRLLQSHQDSPDAEAEPDPDIFRLQDGEVSQLKEWVSEERVRDVFGDLPLILLAALQPDSGKDDESQLIALIQASAEVLLERERTPELVRLMTGLGQVAQNSRDPVIKGAVQKGLSSIEPGRILKVLSGRFSTLTEMERDSVAKLIASLGDTMVSEVVKLLADPEFEAVASSVLERLAARQLDHLLPFLNEPSPAILVPLMRVLTQTGNPAVLVHIRRLFTHDDMRVRREAIRGVGKIGTGNSWTLLAELIRDDDESTRLAALRALERVPPSSYLSELTAMVRRSDFRQRSFIEKTELLIALARVPDKSIDKLLAQLLAKKSFFRREAQTEIRACAATALGRRGGDAARETLARFADDRSSRVSTAVGQALKSWPE